MRVSSFYRLGTFIYRFRIPVILLWIIIILCCIPFMPHIITPFQTTGFVDEQSESAKASQYLNQKLGYNNNRFLILYNSKHLLATNPVYIKKLKKSLSELNDFPIKHEIIYPDANKKQIAKDKHTAYVVVLFESSVVMDHDLLMKFKAAIKTPSHMSMQLGGEAIFIENVNKQTQKDLFKADAVAAPVSIITLILVFGTIIAALVPICLGGGCALIILTTLYFLGHAFSLSIFTLNIALLLGLCLSLDYALFIIYRFRDELRNNKTNGTAHPLSTSRGLSAGSRDLASIMDPADKPRDVGFGAGAEQLQTNNIAEIIAKTLATAGKAVFYSGLAVFISLSALLLFPINILFSVSFGGLTAVFIAVAIAITLLPAVLAVLKNGINWLPVWPRNKETKPIILKTDSTPAPFQSTSHLFIRFTKYALARVYGNRGGARVNAKNVGWAKERSDVPTNGASNMVGTSQSSFTHPTMTGDMHRAGFWQRLASTVVHRPLIFFFSTLIILLLLGYPFLNARFGVSDFHVLPEQSEGRQFFDTYEQKFNGQELTPILLIVSTSQSNILSKNNISKLHHLAQRLEDNPRIKEVNSIVTTKPELTKAQYHMLYNLPEHKMDHNIRQLLNTTTRKQFTVMSIVSKYKANSSETKTLIDELRQMKPAKGLTFQFTGVPVNNVDVLHSIAHIFPYAVAWIMALTYFILLVLLRSLILPLKAIIMTMLSLCASYGVLVFVFQEGHLHQLLNFNPQGMLDISLLIIIFCALFGFSMDYEVFLLTRIQECYTTTKDTKKSIIFGIMKSSRIITSAAIIVIFICGSFMVADVLMVKEFGLGIAVAIFVDAFIIRTLLVPAIMALLKQWNWYLPRWLDRIIPGGEKN